MNISKKEYAQLADRYSAPSKLYITVPKAFVIGGLICCIGQFFTDLYIMIGNDIDTASAYTSITLVLISALLTGFGQYERIAKHAGAGSRDISGKSEVWSIFRKASTGLICASGYSFFR